MTPDGLDRASGAWAIVLALALLLTSCTTPPQPAGGDLWRAVQGRGL